MVGFHQINCETKILSSILVCTFAYLWKFRFDSHFPLQNKILGLLQCYYVRLKCWNHYTMHISVNYFCVFRRLNIAQRCSSNKHICQQRCYDVFSKVSILRRFTRCCFCHSIAAILDLLCCHASRDLVHTLILLTL